MERRLDAELTDDADAEGGGVTRDVQEGNDDAKASADELRTGAWCYNQYALCDADITRTCKLSCERSRLCDRRLWEA